MSPYIELQKQVIEILFQLVRVYPERLRLMVRDYRSSGKRNLADPEYALFKKFGFQEPRDNGDWDWCKDMLWIILEQVNDSGPTIVIRNLLGVKLVGYGETQTLEERLRQGNGNHGNWLRTECSAQSGALKKGDVLQTGDVVLSEPREGGNGRVLIHLDGGLHGAWMPVPARIPIALQLKKVANAEMDFPYAALGLKSSG